jgi:hypothetical protein
LRLPSSFVAAENSLVKRFADKSDFKPVAALSAFIVSIPLTRLGIWPTF